MTPDPPPASSGGSSLPPRHRPTLGNLTKDTTELDLWAFEDDLDLTEPESGAEIPESTRSSAGDIPAPRERQVTKVRDTPSPLHPGPPAGGERIQLNVSKGRHKTQTSGPAAGPSKPESEFDELEHWEDVPKEPEIDELPDADLAQTNDVAMPSGPVAPAPEALAKEPVMPASAELEEIDEFRRPTASMPRRSR